MSSAPDNKYRLSKSRIAAFEHCPKRLWLQVHKRDAARFDEKTLARFRFGHDVGRKAQFAVSEGVLVDTGFDMPAAIGRTRELLDEPERRPIFEATFQYQDVLIRADILMPDTGNSWRLIEVKGAAQVRSYMFADVATQLWVAINSGVCVSAAVIRHLARPVYWPRPDIAAVAFRDTDISGPVSHVIATRRAVVAAARHAVRGAEPLLSVGPHCHRPFACEFRRYCAGMQSSQSATSVEISQVPRNANTSARLR